MNTILIKTKQNYIKLKNGKVEYSFDFLNEDSLLFKTLINHYLKHNYYVMISLEDLKLLERLKWL